MLGVIVGRGLSGDAAGEPILLYTPDQAHIIRILAITFSSIALIAGSTTLYFFWFMQRSFRHDLIMVLIASGMVKAFWYWIYSVVYQAQGTVSTLSNFCQAAGWFLSIGIEGSDFAVLLIAIHNTVYIFNPPATLTEGGLYPYRFIAFAIWAAIPVILASLAFLDYMEGYVAGAANCYLPVRPFWYRLALAWIPRYIIFFLILALDAAVYFYIQHKFGSFTDTFRSPRNSKADLHNLTADEAVGNVARPPKVRRSHSVPPTPQLECNGLAPQLEENGLLPPTDLEAGQSTQPQPRRQPRQAFRNLVPGGDGPSDGSYGFPHVGSGEGQRSSQNGTGHSRVGTMTTISAATPLETPTSWYSLRSFLRRRQTNQESSISTPLSQIQLFDSRTGSNLLEAPILEQRAKIRHQLRFLFIYPIAYLLMWTIPFAAHTIQYNDEYVLNPPYALNALVVVILTSQCTMDCILFSWKEKPWAHARRRQKTLAERGEEVADWWRGRGHKQGNGVATLRRPGGAKGQGKSNKERAAEARVAYRRRDIEASSAAAEGGTRAREREERGERSWWDEFDVGADGNVSPPVAGNGAAPASRVPRAMDGAMSSDVGERTVPASRDGDVTEYGIQMRDFGAGRHDA